MKTSKKATEEQSKAAGSPSISPKATSEPCVKPPRRAGWIHNSSGQMEADWRPEGASDLERLSSTIKSFFSESVKNKGAYRPVSDSVTGRKSTFILLYHYGEFGRVDRPTYWEKTRRQNEQIWPPAVVQERIWFLGNQNRYHEHGSHANSISNKLLKYAGFFFFFWQKPYFIGNNVNSHNLRMWNGGTRLWFLCTGLLLTPQTTTSVLLCATSVFTTSEYLQRFPVNKNAQWNKSILHDYSWSVYGVSLDWPTGEWSTVTWRGQSVSPRRVLLSVVSANICW